MARKGKNNPATRGKNEKVSEVALLSTKTEDVIAKLNERLIEDSKEAQFLCKDEQGFYVTVESLVGSRLMDPYKDPSRRRMNVPQDVIDTYTKDSE